jgi:hypothetical protein
LLLRPNRMNLSFRRRMVWIVNNPGTLIKECRPRLFKGNAMQLLVSTILTFIPNEVYIWHVHIIYTRSWWLSIQGFWTNTPNRQLIERTIVSYFG